MKLAFAATMIRPRYPPDSIIARKVSAPEFSHNLDPKRTLIRLNVSAGVCRKLVVSERTFCARTGSRGHRDRVPRAPHGGRRWWFRCPATGWRVARLHLPSGGQIFAGRRAYGLAYRSQRERAYDRALTRTQDIRVKLGGSPSLAEPFPDKPKG